MMTKKRPHIFVAPDFDLGDIDLTCTEARNRKATEIMLKLEQTASLIRGFPTVGLKLHNEMDVLGGYSIRRLISNFCRSHRLMADPKLKEIPKSMSRRTKSICLFLEPAYMTVSVEAGIGSMQAAIAAAAEISPVTQIVAVGVLTSLSNEDSLAIYNGLLPVPANLNLLHRAYRAGVRHMVAAVPDIIEIRKTDWGRTISFVIPAIRIEGAPVSNDDQKRSSTVVEAILAAGLDEHGNSRATLVTGRSIMDHPGFKSSSDALSAMLVQQQRAVEQLRSKL